MKHIILCADDYGQNLDLSQAIIDLIERKCLSATSCLTTFPAWREAGLWLTSLQNQIDIGLHFNMTEGRSLTSAITFMSLPQLLVKAHLRQLSRSAIEVELNAQIDQFISILGRAPDFIDGHQHVHQFPVISDAIINVYQHRFKNTSVYLRYAHESYGGMIF